MAITIKEDVPEYAPVYNKLQVSCLSTNIANTSFKYIFEVVTTIHGTFTYYVTPEDVLSHGTLEFGRLLQGFIDESINQYTLTASFAQGLTSMIFEYHIEYGEQYDVAGTITDFKDLTTGTTKYCWDASFLENEWITQINLATPFNNWIMSVANGSSTEFLTKYKTPKVILTDLGWTYLLTSAVAEIDYVEIKTYDSSDVLIQTVQSADASNTAVAGKVKAVSTSPQSLNNIAPALLLGAQPIITSSVAYYTIQIFDSGVPTAVSELLTFTLQTACRYEVYRLHFLNELGGFDSYNFTARSLKSKSTSRKSYTRDETVIASGGITYSHENIGTLDYYVRTKEKIKVKSDYLTDSENEWLQELINSPNILWETTDSQGTTLFYPVKGLTNVWVDKTNSVEKLFQLEFDVELALASTRQRR